MWCAWDAFVEAFWVGAKDTYFPKVQRKYDGWLRGKARIADDFWSLQAELRLQCNNRAATIFDKGPANGPHSEESMQKALEALQDGPQKKKRKTSPPRLSLDMTMRTLMRTTTTRLNRPTQCQAQNRLLRPAQLQAQRLLRLCLQHRR